MGNLLGKSKVQRLTLKRVMEEIAAIEERQKTKEREADRRLSAMQTSILGLPAKQDVTDLRNLIVDSTGNLKLATKEDVDQVLTVFKNLKTAASIVSGSSHWAWRALVGLAMFIALISFITGGFKIAAAFLINHAFGGDA